MTYTPTDWKNGDIITAVKLNNMEQGIVNAGSVFTVEVDTETNTFDKTYNEIKGAYYSGKTCVIELIGTNEDSQYTGCASILSFVEFTQDSISVYGIAFHNPYSGDYKMASTDSGNGYPHIIG